MQFFANPPNGATECSGSSYLHYRFAQAHTQKEKYSKDKPSRRAKRQLAPPVRCNPVEMLTRVTVQDLICYSPFYYLSHTRDCKTPHLRHGRPSPSVVRPFEAHPHYLLSLLPLIPITKWHGFCARPKPLAWGEGGWGGVARALGLTGRRAHANMRTNTNPWARHGGPNKCALRRYRCGARSI